MSAKSLSLVVLCPQSQTDCWRHGVFCAFGFSRFPRKLDLHACMWFCVICLVPSTPPHTLSRTDFKALSFVSGCLFCLFFSHIKFVFCTCHFFHGSCIVDWHADTNHQAVTFYVSSHSTVAVTSCIESWYIMTTLDFISTRLVDNCFLWDEKV